MSLINAISTYRTIAIAIVMMGGTWIGLGVNPSVGGTLTLIGAVTGLIGYVGYHHPKLGSGLVIAVLIGTGNSWWHSQAVAARHTHCNTPVVSGVLETITSNGIAIIKTKYTRIGAVHTPFIPHQIGSSVQISGRFIPQLPPTNPGQRTRIYYWNSRKIDGLFLSKTAQITHLRHPNFVTRFIHQIRKSLVSIHQKTLSPIQNTLLTQLLFGTIGPDLPTELETAYKNAGLTHLLVVSGAQVALLTAAVFPLIQSLFRTRIWPVVGLVLCHIAFGTVTGFESSIVRAITMVDVALILNAIWHRIHPLNGLGAAGIGMIMMNPWITLDSGAQLSFLATGGLIASATPIQTVLSKRLPSWMAIILGTTLAPTLWTMPVLWAEFHTISLVSVLSNMAVFTLSEFVVVAGFISTVIGGIIPQILAIIDPVIALSIDTITTVATTMGSIPWRTISIRAPDPLGIMAIYLAIIGGHFSNIWAKTTAIATILTIISIQLWITTHPLPTLTVLDVGQGDCMIIQLPYYAILIDAGPPNCHDIVPALRALGISRLNWVIVTHFHQDHWGGLREIAAQIPIDTIIANPQSDRWASIRTELNRYARQIIAITHPIVIRIPPHTSIKIRPPNPGISNNDNENENSIVTQVRIGKSVWLLTGDMESDGESGWLAAEPSPNATVLKVGHHGSKTSTSPDLLSAVHPNVAIISAGRNNRFGHPHQSVIDRLTEAHCPIYQTNINGAISVQINGQTERVIPFLMPSTHTPDPTNHIPHRPSTIHQINSM